MTHLFPNTYPKRNGMRLLLPPFDIKLARNFRATSRFGELGSVCVVQYDPLAERTHRGIPEKH